MAGGWQVLFEDNHCLAVLKPAGMLTAGDSTGDLSLLDAAREYIREKYQKPGQVFLGLVHRLDRPVSGVVLFARTSKGAARLSAQFREGTIQKVYHALVSGSGIATAGVCRDWLLKDSAANTVTRVAPETPGAREAVLRFRRLETGRDCARVEVELVTGRSHQIRVQLAGLGHPILGDTKYGGRSGGRGTINLHAAALTFQHPTLKTRLTVTAPDPPAWASLLRR